MNIIPLYTSISPFLYILKIKGLTHKDQKRNVLEQRLKSEPRKKGRDE